MPGFLFASGGLVRFGQLGLVFAGGFGALAVVLVVGFGRVGRTGALAVLGGAGSVLILAALCFLAHLALAVGVVSFAVLPVLLLLPLFGAIPGFLRLFLVGVALGQACAVVGVMLGD